MPLENHPVKRRQNGYNATGELAEKSATEFDGVLLVDGGYNTIVQGERLFYPAVK